MWCHQYLDTDRVSSLSDEYNHKQNFIEEEEEEEEEEENLFAQK